MKSLWQWQLDKFVTKLEQVNGFSTKVIHGQKEAVRQWTSHVRGRFNSVGLWFIEKEHACGGSPRISSLPKSERTMVAWLQQGCPEELFPAREAVTAARKWPKLMGWPCMYPKGRCWRWFLACREDVHQGKFEWENGEMRQMRVASVAAVVVRWLNGVEWGEKWW